MPFASDKNRALAAACVGILFLLLPIARVRCEGLADYTQWTSRSYPYAVRILASDPETALAQATALLNAGVSPVTVQDKGSSKTVDLGCFQTMMEADCVKRHLRDSGLVEAFITTVSLQCTTSHYDNPLTPTLWSPRSGLRLVNSQDLELVSGIVGKQSPDSFDLAFSEVVKSAFQVPGCPPTTASLGLVSSAIRGLPTTSPLKLRAIRIFSEVEIASSGTVTLIGEHVDEFIRGELAAEPDEYAADVLRFADYLHEFATQPQKAFHLYNAILDGKTGIHATSGQRVRALVELAALSREQTRRGVGRYQDTSYWWNEFKRRGFLLTSRAAAVIELIMLENYDSDKATLLRSNMDRKSEFRAWCSRYRKRYSRYARERLFLNNLELSLILEVEERQHLVQDTISLYPLPDNEVPQWAGNRLPFLSGLLLSAHRFAKSDGNDKAQEQIEEMMSSVSLDLPPAVLEPHKTFETTM